MFVSQCGRYSTLLTIVASTDASAIQPFGAISHGSAPLIVAHNKHMSQMSRSVLYPRVNLLRRLSSIYSYWPSGPRIGRLC
jgi:hypothetical protein